MTLAELLFAGSWFQSFKLVWLSFSFFVGASCVVVSRSFAMLKGRSDDWVVVDIAPLNADCGANL